MTPPNNTVRIFDGASVIGAGVLIMYDQVITNAHVVNRALNRNLFARANPVNVTISLDFPFLESEKMRARVVRWLPPSETNIFKGDIATLRLEKAPPEGVTRKKLLEIETQRFSQIPALVYGFPENIPNGVWASGVLRGAVKGGRIQVDGLVGSGYAVTSGFSGAPVWDESKQRLLGIVCVADRAGVNVFYMIPARELSTRLDFEQPQRGNASWKLKFFRQTAMTALLDDLSDLTDDGLEDGECNMIVKALDKIANATSDFEGAAFWDRPIHQDIESFQTIYRNWNGYERGKPGTSDRREAMKRLRQERGRLSDKIREYRGVLDQPDLYGQGDDDMFAGIFSAFEEIAHDCPKKFRNIRGMLSKYNDGRLNGGAATANRR
ncbi:MAG: trypsin-like peptidase domain-containing protein [Candidatus Eremiobacteraeota bacterium]|nr:trypsin-like peptidase domain-containing protein [Candidatus Eremiobacteraeota bacterium]